MTTNSEVRILPVISHISPSSCTACNDIGNNAAWSPNSAKKGKREPCDFKIWGLSNKLSDLVRFQRKRWEYAAGPSCSDPAPQPQCCRDRWLWRGTLHIKARPVPHGPPDLSYRLTLSQIQCPQGHSATYISHQHCPKVLNFSENTLLWNSHSIWEHPLSQTEALQNTSHHIAGCVALCTDLEGYRTAISWH